MEALHFKGLRVGLVVKNNRTQKNWMITDMKAGYSSVSLSNPDLFKVRLSNGNGKNLEVEVSQLRKNYYWPEESNKIS